MTATTTRASTEAEDDSLDARLEERLAKVAASIAEQEALLASAARDEAADATAHLDWLKRHERALRRIEATRHETVDVRIIVLGEGDEEISALPLVNLLRPLVPLLEDLLIETEPAKEKLYSTLKIECNDSFAVERARHGRNVVRPRIFGARVRYRQDAGTALLG